MKEKAFVIVAVCAVLGLSVSTGTAVYLAIRPAPVDVRVIRPEKSDAEDAMEVKLVLKKSDGTANSDDEMRLRMIRERQFLRELWEIEQKERAGR